MVSTEEPTKAQSHNVFTHAPSRQPLGPPLNHDCTSKVQQIIEHILTDGLFTRGSHTLASQIQPACKATRTCWILVLGQPLDISMRMLRLHTAPQSENLNFQKFMMLHDLAHYWRHQQQHAKHHPCSQSTLTSCTTIAPV